MKNNLKTAVILAGIGGLMIIVGGAIALLVPLLVTITVSTLAMVYAYRKIGHAASDPAVRLARLNARLDMMREFGPSGLAEQRSANVLAPDAPAQARELVKLARHGFQVPGQHGVDHQRVGQAVVHVGHRARLLGGLHIHPK